MENADTLNAADRQWLLTLARRTLENLEPTGDRVPPESALVEGTIPESVREPRGVFVTLHGPNGALRGCIGYVLPMEPLYKAVIANAVSAARHDPRFPPVIPQEVPELHIEISVLTVPREITSIDEIEVGRDGLILSVHGTRRGLLLPQVATEYDWNREEFLDHTCRKAGLAPGSWRDPEVTVEVFSAQVFSEPRD